MKGKNDIAESLTLRISNLSNELFNETNCLLMQGFPAHITFKFLNEIKVRDELISAIEEGENLLDNNIGETAVNRLGEAILKGVNTVEMYYKRFDELKSIVKTPIPLSAFHDAKRAGRPKASTDKHLKDFLKRCDSCTVTQAVMNCPYRDKPGFFGQLLIALLDLGYIEISDIGKELYKAIKNDFPEAPSIDSIRKICPQNEWVINKNKSRYKYKIEEIKKLF